MAFLLPVQLLPANQAASTNGGIIDRAMRGRFWLRTPFVARTVLEDSRQGARASTIKSSSVWYGESTRTTSVQ